MSQIGQQVTLKSADGTQIPAWAAIPQGPVRGAVVVVQEIFGVNSHIRDVTERWAAQGFAAIAPAMYERLVPATSAHPLGVELGYSGDDMQKGIAMKAQAEALPAPGVLQDIAAAAQWLKTTVNAKVGVTGFCWGGLLTWRAACQLPEVDAAVSYYGGGMTVEPAISQQPQCPVMAHFGNLDHFISMDSVRAFEAVHPKVEVHVYDADHGFNCDQRGSYNAAAAQLANQRTVDFFTQHLKA